MAAQHDTDDARETHLVPRVAMGRECIFNEVLRHAGKSGLAGRPLARDQLELPIEGLMCIPPLDENPALHFTLLRKIAERNGLPGLSMGMSGDYETAVRCGATIVRVGSAIFGPRRKPPA